MIDADVSASTQHGQARQECNRQGIRNPLPDYPVWMLVLAIRAKDTQPENRGPGP